MSDGNSEALGKIARSLDLLVKLKVKESQGDRSTKDMILLLNSFGCTPTEIAKALGKTPNDVSPVLTRAKRAPKKSTKKLTSKPRGK